MVLILCPVMCLILGQTSIDWRFKNISSKWWYPWWTVQMIIMDTLEFHIFWIRKRERIRTHLFIDLLINNDMDWKSRVLRSSNCVDLMCHPITIRWTQSTFMGLMRPQPSIQISPAKWWLGCQTSVLIVCVMSRVFICIPITIRFSFTKKSFRGRRPPAISV